MNTSLLGCLHMLAKKKQSRGCCEATSTLWVGRAMRQTGLTHSSLWASLLIGLEGPVRSNRDAGVQSQICGRETCQIWYWAHQGGRRDGIWGRSFLIPSPKIFDKAIKDCSSIFEHMVCCFTTLCTALTNVLQFIYDNLIHWKVNNNNNILCLRTLRPPSILTHSHTSASDTGGNVSCPRT